MNHQRLCAVFLHCASAVFLQHLKGLIPPGIATPRASLVLIPICLLTCSQKCERFLTCTLRCSQSLLPCKAAEFRHAAKKIKDLTAAEQESLWTRRYEA